MALIPFREKQIVGMVGAYKVDNLPPEIYRKVSYGLTIINEDGTVSPGIADRWTITDNGKTYTFYLKSNLKFSDGDTVTSDKINYNFADATVERPDKQTIIFKLKDAYAPFLVTVSQPVFKSGSVGVGEYEIADVELNGGFVKQLQVVSTKNKFDTIYYSFYPSEEALKYAFALGEVTQAKNITDDSFKQTNFKSFPNAKLEQITNYNKLVALFYNTNDSVLSDKKIRNGLSYALPNEFRYGKRTYVSFSPKSKFHTKELLLREQDFNHAKLLLESSQESASNAAAITLEIKTQEKYLPVAKEIQQTWAKAGVNTTIETVDSVPDRFQIFLGDFTLPRDPDQYVLWHSDQQSNITKYKNLRIDKLLEDGRKVTNVSQREQIYEDFQKYLHDDSPASFLYFPYTYTIVRK